MNRNDTPYSQLKIFHHPDTLNKLLNKQRCNPIYIRIKPTNKCNHNCSYCHYKNSYIDLDEYNPTDEIPRDKMLETVSSMAKLGVKAVTFSGGGEPLLYPYIEETMTAVLDAGIDLSIITNGSMLKDDKAKILAKSKWVRISVESVNDDEYCSIRKIKPGSFNNLCDNIKNFSRIKDDSCELGINMVISRDNHHQVKDMAHLMCDLGVNHVKFAPMITNDTRAYHNDFKDEVTGDLHDLEEEYKDSGFRVINLYTADFADSVVFSRDYSYCPSKEFLCIIGANQKVYFCQDKAYMSDGCVGDLSKHSFSELWTSDEVSTLFKQFDAKKICTQHCVHDSRNKLISSFLNIDKNHINYI